ncbi:MAG: flagellar hook-associated protein 3 [Treponema sp.]|nr:flagellar hook-associated protein 3 [Treponema sp.]MCL2250945.1 flagellar hook-associated protein 3 [Treponema sp.]
MRRVSSDMSFTDMQFYLERRQDHLNQIENRIGSQSRLKSLRDDPIAASHAARYDSFLSRLNRFEQNTKYAMEHYDNTYDYLNSTNEIIQRIRELAVAGGNGIFSPDELKVMGVEVNELLKELVSISNAIGPDTKQAFAGDKVFTEPFRIVEGTVDGGLETMITRVEYRGSGATRNIEVGDNMFVALDIGGDTAFWAEKMQIYSTLDGTDYRVQEAGAFYIDGVEIHVGVGDTLPSIVAKINESGAPVKAFIDPNTRGLSLEGTNAHLIRAEDKTGGASVLRDLGIIRGNMENNAPNWSSSAMVSGGSIFDMVIRLRDGMMRGDHEFIGSQGIAGMDLAVNNITFRMADVGSRKERTEFAWQRINKQIPDISAMLHRETGLDMQQAAMDLNMARFAHQAALQTSARILPSTLLDFLR